MKFIVLVALVSAALPSVLAKCCGGSIDSCADGTKATPCCATGKCNIFCCACKGSCRSGKRAIEAEIFKRGVEVEENLYGRDTSEAFAMADVDGSGNITLSQYLAYMKVDGQSEVHSNWFNLHDKNGDGVITPDEITRD